VEFPNIWPRPARLLLRFHCVLYQIPKKTTHVELAPLPAEFVALPAKCFHRGRCGPALVIADTQLSSKEPMVIWANLFTFFFVSLIPFLTAYMAETRMSSCSCRRRSSCKFGAIAELRAMDRAAIKRKWIALAAYAVAIAAAYLHPAVSLVIIGSPRKARLAGKSAATVTMTTTTAMALPRGCHAGFPLQCEPSVVHAWS
jgi:hypothetical protein